MTPTLIQSKALHEAVARYRVVTVRRLPTKSVQEVAVGLTYRQAKELQGQLDTGLAVDDSQWRLCMCRSSAEIELTNKAEVAQVLGYGPGFSYEAAVKGVEEFLKASKFKLDQSVAENDLRALGILEVTEAFAAACL